jgi:spermidine synthase
MTGISPDSVRPTSRATIAAIALVSAALLMTQLALTRIFSVTMFYHFAFLAISIALFGLSASGVYVYLARRRWASLGTDALLARYAVLFVAATVVALAGLIRIRVGLNYSFENLVLMLAIYLLAALPFFTGGVVIALAVTRLQRQIGLVYASDLVGAAAGCLILLPLMNLLGAPGVVLSAALLGAIAAVIFAPAARRLRTAALAGVVALGPWGVQSAGLTSFDVVDTKGHQGDRVLFSKWNSFSRVAVYDRGHGDWSLSPRFEGQRPETRFMDIDSAASTPILRGGGDPAEAAYLRYDLTSLAFHLKSPESILARAPEVLRTSSSPQSPPAGFTALVIGPGGGRDLLAALVFGVSRVDGVEINPIIARDVMLGRFREFSGGLYAHPKVRIAIDDGRSYVRRSRDRYDIIQASLVDTWAATAAGAYTLTENTLYTVEAFEDYLDTLTEHGIVTVSRWVFDGLRLVSLAQEACARRRWDPSTRLAVVQHGRVANFMLKKSPFTEAEIQRLAEVAEALEFTVLYAPGRPPASQAASLRLQGSEGTDVAPGDADLPNDYARLILTPDRDAFHAAYPLDVRPTFDDRPFFFHTTKLEHQAQLAFGKGALFGNGLSALLSLMGISALLVLIFVLGPLALTSSSLLAGSSWPVWLAYFGCLGAGFMLIEVAILQQFVLLLGHPVYSLTVTLFSLLLGTGLGSFLSRRIPEARLRSRLVMALATAVLLSIVAVVLFPALIRTAVGAPLALRILMAVCLLLPVGIVLGVPLPSGVRLLSAQRSQLVPWAWGMNGALSVFGATFAVFLAMNWGFSATLLAGAGVYALAAGLIFISPRSASAA